MGNISDHYANFVLDAVFGDNHTSDFPNDLWMTLYTTDPGNDNSGVELDHLGTMGLARQHLVNNSTTFPAATSFYKTIAQDIVFGPAVLEWGAIPYWAIMDSDTIGTGNLLAFGRLGGNRPPRVPIGGQITIPAHSLKIRIKRSMFT